MSAVAEPLTPAQAALVREGADLALQGANRLRSRWVGLLREDEARACATDGLIRAARTFDPSLGVPFGAYARFRVEGEIFDGIRAEARHRGAASAVRAASRHHLAHQVDPGDVMRDGPAAQQAHVARFIEGHAASMVAALVAHAHRDEGEEAMVLRDEYRRATEGLREATERLPERDRKILRMRYDEEKELGEIGDAMGVSYATIRRHHQAVIARLGTALMKLGVQSAPPVEGRPA